ncbi:MAG: hypothetical protein Q7U57_17225 [Methylovulum sp.]|nr:hypothetical protein [Methylovulum sp.]
MSSISPKRHQVFIKKAFQGRFIAGVFLLILLSGLCSALLIYWLTGSDLQAQSQAAHVSIANAGQRLGLSILIGNVVAVVVTGILTIYVVLYATHKIAGPLYRFETLCEHVGNGELDVISSLRENDQLHDLAQAFTTMVDKLRKRRDRQNEAIADINQHVQQLKSDEYIASHQPELLARLEQAVKQLQNK